MATLLERTISQIRPLDKEAMAQARARQVILTKPEGSLGRLEELSIQLAGIQGKSRPHIEHKVVFIMAGDHGVVSEKVGNWPQEVTAQMVYNFLNGGAAINIIASQIGARVIVVDMGTAAKLRDHPKLVSRKISYGTNNMAKEPAMTEEQAVRAVEAGIELVMDEMARGVDIIATGDMGIGNTTPSAAICAVLMGKSVSETTGRGTGITDEQLNHKIDVIRKAIHTNRPSPQKPLEVLAKVGGFEIAGLAGVMLAAAAHRIPVVIDGFISGAAALTAAALSPILKNFLIPAHISAETGHGHILRYLGLRPLLDLSMRLGEGTGAALGIFLAETAAKLLAEMATFSEAKISESTESRS